MQGGAAKRERRPRRRAVSLRGEGTARAIPDGIERQVFNKEVRRWRNFVGEVTETICVCYHV